MSRLVNAVSRRIPRAPKAIWQDFPVATAVLWLNRSAGTPIYAWESDGGSGSVSSVFGNAAVAVDATGGPTGANAGPLGVGMYFTGGDVIQADILSRYDRFFLHSVTVKVTPVYVHGGGAMPVCDAYAIPEYDGYDTVTASVASVQGRPAAVKETWNVNGDVKPLVITIRPCLSTAVYAGVVVSGYATTRAWLSTNYAAGASAAQWQALRFVFSQCQYPGSDGAAPLMGLRFELSYRIGLKEMLGGTTV